MENIKAQIIDAINGANNVLVTVSNDPGVDELSAAIGLTLLLNKMGKHGTAVYSGATPDVIEFLNPEKTIEKNTDSLRDFIIALDKSKADKLRYKVEGDHVRIFITPYKTSISEKDLDFSQGDFNVDVVIALGVVDQKELDRAITSHGRILHDATVVSVNTDKKSSLGSINWSDDRASSLCEMIASIVKELSSDGLDAQMATAFMTGIVSETQRFSNEKTTAGAMNASAMLMSAGANQQLVANKLMKPVEPAMPASTADESQSPDVNSDGALVIEHPPHEYTIDSLPPVGTDNKVDEIENILSGLPSNEPIAASYSGADVVNSQSSSSVVGGGALVLDPPSLGSKLTASADINTLDPAVDPLSSDTKASPILSRQNTKDKIVSSTPPASSPAADIPGPSMELPSERNAAPVAPAPTSSPVTNNRAPSSVASADKPTTDAPHAPVPTKVSPGTKHPENVASPVPSSTSASTASPSPAKQSAATSNLESARDAVVSAMSTSAQPLPPLEAIASQTALTVDHDDVVSEEIDHIDETTGVPRFKSTDPAPSPLPSAASPQSTTQPTSAGAPTSPPPVPPPMMPFNAPPAASQSQAGPPNLPPVR